MAKYMSTTTIIGNIVNLKNLIEQKNLKLIFLFALYILPMCINAQNYKQKSLVTNEMANKITLASQYLSRNAQGQLQVDFCYANNCYLSSMEYDKLMLNISDHKDLVENFICYVLGIYGTGNLGYAYFKSLNYTINEFDIAVKIYEDWNKKREEIRREKEKQEKLKKIENDKKIISDWEKNGKDTLITGHNSLIAPIISYNRNGEKIIIGTEEKQNIKEEYNNNFNNETSQIYEFIIGEDSNITYIDEEKWKNDLSLSNISFNALSPGYVHFESLDTTIAIPTKNNYYYITIWKKINSYNSNIEHEEIIIKDKTGKWKIKDETKLRMWFEKLGFTIVQENSLIELINKDLCKHLENENGKIFKVIFKLRGANTINEYINGKIVNSITNSLTMIFISKEKIK